ncbi:hypothetical protein BJX99DRAFT_260052 [Aspergillus californicus]
MASTHPTMQIYIQSSPQNTDDSKVLSWVIYYGEHPCAKDDLPNWAFITIVIDETGTRRTTETKPMDTEFLVRGWSPGPLICSINVEDGFEETLFLGAVEHAFGQMEHTWAKALLERLVEWDWIAEDRVDALLSEIVDGVVGGFLMRGLSTI